jgi:hypothetical protein
MAIGYVVSCRRRWSLLEHRLPIQFGRSQHSVTELAPQDRLESSLLLFTSLLATLYIDFPRRADNV